MKWNLCICLLSLSVVGYSQNTRSEKNPYSNDIKNYKIKKEKKNIFPILRRKEKTEIEEFRRRVQKAYRENEKISRELEKPRYANPLYFGHRRPPKKRPLGKQKFCKTCRIKH